MADFQFNQYPPELATQIRSAERRRRIAQTLLKQSLDPIQSQGVAPVSPFQGLAQLAQTYVAAKGDISADKAEADAATKRQQWVRDIVMGSFGPGAPPMTKDRAVMLSTVPIPEVAAVGLHFLKDDPIKWLQVPDASLEGRQGAYQAAVSGQGDAAAAAALRAQKKLTPVDGTLVDVNDPANVGQYFGDEYERDPTHPTGMKIYDVPGADGKSEPYLKHLKSGFLKKMDNAPKTTVTQSQNVENKQASEAAKRAGVTQTDQVDKAWESASRSVIAIDNSHKILQALDEGAITGTTANPRLIGARLAETFGQAGKDEKEKIANTRKLIMSLADAELEAAAKIKGQGQVTEAERAILKRASSGEFAFSESELRQIAANLEQVGRKNLAWAERMRTRYQEDYPDVKTGVWKIDPPGPYEKNEWLKNRVVNPPAKGEKVMKREKPLDKYEQFKRK